MTSFWSAVINAAILGALLSLAVWFALRMTSRNNLDAATRHAIWWIVLLSTLVLPLSLVPWRASLQAQTSRLTAPISHPRYFRYDTPVERNASTPVLSLPLEIPASPLLRVILIFWMAASLLLLARVFISYAALYRRTARATTASPELNLRLTGWLAQCGSSRTGARLATSGEIEIPIATGPFCTSILIPQKLFDAMTDTDLEQICLHEAAHLARRDDYALFLQRIIEALFALHPVVRFVTRQIDLEREIACDDMVVGSSDQARSYADCLTRTVACCGGVRTSLAAANVADGRSHLSRRIELLVDKTRTRRIHLFKTRLAVTAIILISAAGLLTRAPLFIAFAAPQTPTDKPPQLMAQAQPPAQLAPTQPATPKEQTPFELERQLANSQLQARQLDAAIATYRDVLTKTDDLKVKAALWISLSQAYRYKGDFADGIATLEKAFEQLPDNAAIATNLALLYEAQNDNIHARHYYERAVAIDPSNPLALNNLAYLLTETNGDLDLALTYARAAQQKLPNFLEVNDTIGWIYLKKNMTSDALGSFKILIDATPNNPEYRYHYAMALFQSGNRVDALEECKSALRILNDGKAGAGPIAVDTRALMDKIAPIMDPRGDFEVK